MTDLTPIDMADSQYAPAEERQPKPNGVDGGGEIQAGRPRFKFYHWSELSEIRPLDYIVKGVIDQGALSVVYGDSNSGKTFLALDLSLHIALGWEWCGRRVAKHGVAYLALEGGRGISRRLEAFKLHHAIADETRDDKDAAPFYVWHKALDLRLGTDTPLLCEAINQIGGIGLIVVDTLSLALAGGNENAAEDMTALILNCLSLARETGAHVAIIHHSGKDSSRGSRGHSSLKGNVDTEIEVTRAGAGDKTVVATITKQREGERGGSFAFNLTWIETGTDYDGDPVGSCVAVPTDIPAKAKKLPPAAETALQQLETAIIDLGNVPPYSKDIPANVLAVQMEVWAERCRKADISGSDKPDSQSKAFKRARAALKNRGKIGFWDSYVWLADKPDKGGQGDPLSVSGHV